MVGGLVQEQHVRLRQQQAAQGDASPLAPGQGGDVRLPGRQAQRVGGNLQLALQLPAIGGVNGILEAALFLQQLVHLIIVQRFAELHADLVEAVQQLLRLGDALLDVAAHVLVRIQFRFLGQVADLDAGLRARLAVEFLFHAGHDFQQRGLAGTVQAQHADLGAREKGQADVTQDVPLGRHDLGDPIHGVDVLSHAARADVLQGARLWVNGPCLPNGR